MKRRTRKATGNAALAIVGYEAARTYWNASHPDRAMPNWRDLDAERSVAWIEAAKAIRAALADAPPAGGGQ